MAEGDNKLAITIGSALLVGWLVLLYLSAGIGALSGMLLGAAAGVLGAVAFPLFGSAYNKRAQSFGPLPWFTYFFIGDVLNRRYRARRIIGRRTGIVVAEETPPHDFPLKKDEQSKKTSPDDADLNSVDLLLCILLPGIAFILGIVYLIRGKPKGAKTIGVSIAAAIAWGLLTLLMRSAR